MGTRIFKKMFQYFRLSKHTEELYISVDIKAQFQLELSDIWFRPLLGDNLYQENESQNFFY